MLEHPAILALAVCTLCGGIVCGDTGVAFVKKLGIQLPRSPTEEISAGCSAPFYYELTWHFLTWHFKQGSVNFTVL